MSSRQESGVRSQGSGVRGQGSGFGKRGFACGCRPPTTYYLLPTLFRAVTAIAWLIGLLASALPARVCRAEESAVQRRQRIEEMEPVEQKQLLRQYKRFAALKPEEQEQLRELHRKLAGHANADQLRRVMRAYCEWLGSLPADTRTELLHLEPKERIERIRELRAKEAERPSPKDMEGLHRWMKEYAEDPEHQERIFQVMFEAAGSREPWMIDTTTMKERLEEMKKKPEDRRIFARMVLGRHMSRPGKPDWLTEDDLAEIRKNLSDDTRKRLEQKPPAKQWETISSWFRPSGGRSFSGRRFRGGPPPKEIQEQLDQFFENELSPKEREELLNLPPDEMQRRLQWMYFRRSSPMRPMGPPHGRRPNGRGSGPRGRPGPPGDGRHERPSGPGRPSEKPLRGSGP